MKGFWLQPVSPLNLGLCRVLWFAFLFGFYFSTDFSRWGDVDELFWSPMWPFTRFSRPPFSTATLSLMQGVWKISLGLACVGLWTRASTAVALPLGAILLGLPHCFGHVHHYDAVVPLILAILACARSGDAVSLDRVVSRALGNATPPAASGEYRWPVRAVWVLLAMVFLAAGLAKLRTSGLRWITSDNLSITLAAHQYSHQFQVWTQWGLIVARHHWLCVALSATTVFFECGLSLALFFPRARAVLAGGAAALLLGFPMLMGPFFVPLLAAFLFWAPWDRALQGIGRACAQREAPIAAPHSPKREARGHGRAAQPGRARDPCLPAP
ncbi:MAG: hypothetical protein ACT4QC_08390 [Planctomycetaceae bacterium]